MISEARLREREREAATSTTTSIYLDMFCGKRQHLSSSQDTPPTTIALFSSEREEKSLLILNLFYLLFCEVKNISHDRVRSHVIFQLSFHSRYRVKLSTCASQIQIHIQIQIRTQIQLFGLSVFSTLLFLISYSWQQQIRKLR